MKVCSAVECDRKAIKEITIPAESAFTDKSYRMDIFVCKQHYEIEKQNIINERPITEYSNGELK